MKKLDKFILKSFIGPFFGILAVVIFILMMQFLWLYIDELVGKGLSLQIILEFMLWGSATMLPISLPLATLLASVMTIGQMAENNELIAIKASGTSLLRVMTPIFICSLFIFVGAYFAANNLVPIAYNKIFTMRDDIGSTKNEINIPTGTFYDGIEGYVLKIDERDKKTGMMKGVMVYDHTDNKGNTSITVADSAMMQMSKSKDYLTFQLYSGINYQETNTMKYKDTTLQLSKIDFSKQEMVIPLKNYAFKKSEGDKYGDQVRAKDTKHLVHDVDSASHNLDSTRIQQYKMFFRSRTFEFYNQIDTSAHFGGTTPYDIAKYNAWPDITMEQQAIQNAITTSEDLSSRLKNYDTDRYQYDWTIRRSTVEILKKIAQALACIIMFLIGAPLGAFVNKKGGMGTNVIVAVLFFVLYWVVDITGIKLANDGAVKAAAGVFISTLVLFPIGVYLSWKAINDSAVIKTENFGQWWRTLKSKIMSIFRKERIVYMGTPEFAVAPLDALVKEGYNIVGVVTVADKPSGRGLKVNESPVKKYAVEHGIPVLQPIKLKDPEFLEQLAALKADLFVVVAFRMLPEVVWKMPPLGTFNLHAALLPQYRGAAPINWAVINGERRSGVTTFMIDKDIDTGGIMLRQDVMIGPEDSAGDLHDALMPVGADLVVQTVKGILEKNIETRVQRSFIQGSEVLKPAPKLTRELCHIDWNSPTVEIHNLIRGLSPYPTAFATIKKEGGDEMQLKIFRTNIMKDAPEGKTPGTVLSDGKSYFAITTADGALLLEDIQLSGKKRMEVKAFLAGFRDPESYHATPGTSHAEIMKTRTSPEE
ncbi:MAG: methionyl-tRNA formyltransferase [Bacteroidales bacterium]|nr:methionyl-tRNA formyltransferase [Bacteroidales bacterium]